jgi:hypothetical protein
MRAMTMPRLWAFLAIFLPVLAAIIANLPSVDLAYHLRAGGQILDGAGIPIEDTWTYTAAGADWLDQQWGAQLAMATVYRALGWTGLVLLRASLIGLTFGLVFVIARRRAVASRPAALLTLAAFVVAAVALALRPQLFGIACFAITLFLVTERRRHPGWLWAVPVVVVVWANLHGSFFLGPLVVGLAWLEDVADGVPRASRTLLVALVSALAACVTPFGPMVWVYAAGLTLDPEVTERISEWQPTSLRTVPGILFFSSVMGVVMLLARSGATAPWPRLAWLAVFFLIGVYAIRGVAWWPVATAALIAGWLIAAMPDGAVERPGTPLMRRFNIVVAGLLILVAVALLPVWRPRDEDVGAPTGVVGTAPSGITATLREISRPGDRLFNPQVLGSWFEFALPDLPVALDSRIEVFPPEVWDDYQAVIDGVEGWQDLLDRWGVTIVVTLDGDDALDARLAANGWREIHRDDDGAVFVRSDRGASVLSDRTTIERETAMTALLASIR